MPFVELSPLEILAAGAVIVVLLYMLYILIPASIEASPKYKECLDCGRVYTASFTRCPQCHSPNYELWKHNDFTENQDEDI